MEKNQEITQKIITCNATFERWLKDHKSSFKEFTDDVRYSRFREDAMFLHNLRNMAAHGSLQYIDVLDIALQRIDNFVSVITSENLRQTMTPIQELYTAKSYDRVLPVIKTLMEKNYSYLPVLNDNQVCEYVFSPYVLMAYMCTGKTIDENTTFMDLYSAVADDLETYNPATFLPVECSIVHVIEAFKVTDDFHQDVVLVTEDGNWNSPLLGLITIWDMQ